MSTSAETTCPPHNYNTLMKTTLTVVGVTPHTYVESVINNKPVYGTCIIERIVTVRRTYECICGQTKTVSDEHTRHTKCGQ